MLFYSRKCYLLIHRNDKKWVEDIGGKLEHSDKDLIDGVIREVCEETMV